MAENIQYKCPKCGGPLDFDSKSQKLVCPFCDSSYGIDEVEAEEKKESSFEGEWDTSAGTAWESGEEESIKVWKCPSCTGEIIGDENTAATICPYCGNRTVMSGQLSGTLKPDLIIPFKKNKNDAIAAFEKNIQGKKLVPRIFRDRHHIEEIKGIYVPFWLFDANAYADIDFEAQRLRMWSDSKNDYTETSFYRVNRHGNISFENLPADASKKMDDALMESIEPFNYQEAIPFSMPYLSGYLADKYDVGIDDSIERVTNRMKSSVRTAFRQTVTGYDFVNVESMNIKLTESRAKYAMLPVWLLNTSYEGKIYSFAMNGQTGEYAGNLPMDKGSYSKWLIGLTAIIAVILFIFLGNVF